jgi:hypothetical protein
LRRGLPSHCDVNGADGPFWAKRTMSEEATVAQASLDLAKASAKIGALEVWVKDDGHWKLLARQGFQT